MARIAAVFPNEGSQYVGVGREFYNKSMSVRKYFDDAEKLLGLKLAKLCFLGPKEDQDKLLNAHLVTFVTECAFFDPVVQKKRKPDLLTGVGVGEVAALVCAESLPYLNGLQYVVKRAALLEEFANKHQGSGLFVTGIPLEKLQPLLARQDGELRITHTLAPDTFILWGPKESVGSFQAEVQGVKEIKTNPQAPRGPLFSPLASELEGPLEKLLLECLEGLPLKNPKIAFHRSSDGEYVGTPEAVRDVLTKQYSFPVQWVQTVTVANSRGFRIWAEVGPGKLYGQLVRKIDKNNLVTNVEDMNSLNTMVKVTG